MYRAVNVSSSPPHSIVLHTGPRPEDWRKVEVYTGPDAARRACEMVDRLNATQSPADRPVAA